MLKLPRKFAPELISRKCGLGLLVGFSLLYKAARSVAWWHSHCHSACSESKSNPAANVWTSLETCYPSHPWLDYYGVLKARSSGNVFSSTVRLPLAHSETIHRPSRIERRTGCVSCVLMNINGNIKKRSFPSIMMGGLTFSAGFVDNKDDCVFVLHYWKDGNYFFSH